MTRTIITVNEKLYIQDGPTTEFKNELLNFKADQLKMLHVLDTNPQKYKETIGILENLIGKENLKM